VAEQYRRPIEQWLDLSTGISPWSWPVPSLPSHVWQQLPNDNDDLEHLAQQYYGAKTRPLAVPGSQWLIRQLPRFLMNNAAVALPLWGYQEHALAWQSQGYRAVFYQDWAELQALLQDEQQLIAYVVVINPNNPSATVYKPEKLYALEQQLAERRGLLIVDEAFGDCHPEDSLLRYSALKNAVVFRSVGKFFGLAGIRLGFGFLPEWMRPALALECQPWAVSHPSRYIGAQCLQDAQWQNYQRERLASAAVELEKILQKLQQPLAKTDYFISLVADESTVAALHQCFIEQSIYIRRFDAQAGQAMLRFGLCEAEQLPRVQRAVDIFLEQQCL
jgi:cobalamin biosynthetic protein CobC